MVSSYLKKMILNNVSERKVTRFNAQRVQIWIGRSKKSLDPPSFDYWLLRRFNNPPSNHPCLLPTKAPNQLMDVPWGFKVNELNFGFVFGDILHWSQAEPTGSSSHSCGQAPTELSLRVRLLVDPFGVVTNPLSWQKQEKKPSPLKWFSILVMPPRCLGWNHWLGQRSGRRDRWVNGWMDGGGRGMHTRVVCTIAHGWWRWFQGTPSLYDHSLVRLLRLGMAWIQPVLRGQPQSVTFEDR